MLKVIIDFLLSQGDAILKNPPPFAVIFLIGFALGWFVVSWSKKNRFETNEERLKLGEQQIQDLEQKLAYQGELKPNDNRYSLNEYQIIALRKISKFEQENPVPAEYSVDNLVKDWQIDRDEADRILTDIRTLELFRSLIWDNVPQFPNLARPINEAKPGRLTKKGKEFLRNYRSED